MISACLKWKLSVAENFAGVNYFLQLFKRDFKTLNPTAGYNCSYFSICRQFISTKHFTMAVIFMELTGDFKVCFNRLIVALYMISVSMDILQRRNFQFLNEITPARYCSFTLNFKTKFSLLNYLVVYNYQRFEIFNFSIIFLFTN